MKVPVIAIVDVGKTNKKLFMFDRQYQIVWERTEQFAETVDDDGDPCEDLERLTEWMLSLVGEVLALPQFDVQAINFSAYGASLVYVGENGQPVGHLYNYLKSYPDSIRQQFYSCYGPADVLSVQTASPALDSLNSGLMLYRIKYDKPALFRDIRYALHLPQYLSYIMTRQALSDLTSVGCHTTLWDFTKNHYHDWVVAEGLDSLMGTLFDADKAMPIPMDGGRELKAGVGLHDSSAALIPYLASFEEAPFVLISTGTWCISMNPFNTEPLTAEELQCDCLCYLTYKGQPVKASRLFAGYEHEQQTKRLAQHFGVSPEQYKHVRYNAPLIEQLQQTLPEAQPAEGLIPPVLMPSLAGSAFGSRDLTRFDTYEIAYHQLMFDLMAGQLISTALVLPRQDDMSSGSTSSGRGVTRIFVDGGFSQNSIYMNLLAAAFPDVEVSAASIAQATALGAALSIHNQWNPLPVPPNLITLTSYKAP
ncbi:MAG TPA: FGGY family carbohydrate kinase [Spirosoma sp.]|nr:FGGY family carbohydrate kinase [Spirosoma sp.]